MVHIMFLLKSWSDHLLLLSFSQGSSEYAISAVDRFINCTALSVIVYHCTALPGVVVLPCLEWTLQSAHLSWLWLIIVHTALFIAFGPCAQCVDPCVVMFSKWLATSDRLWISVTTIWHFYTILLCSVFLRSYGICAWGLATSDSLEVTSRPLISECSVVHVVYVVTSDQAPVGFAMCPVTLHL